MRLNPDTAMMTAHRLLVSADVFTDNGFGASGYRVCKEATLSQARIIGSKLFRLNDGLDFNLDSGSGALPDIEDVIWPGTCPALIILNWDRIISSAHSRHAIRN
jgi:hypothetical protein